MMCQNLPKMYAWLKLLKYYYKSKYWTTICFPVSPLSLSLSSCNINNISQVLLSISLPLIHLFPVHKYFLGSHNIFLPIPSWLNAHSTAYSQYFPLFLSFPLPSLSLFASSPHWQGDIFYAFWLFFDAFLSPCWLNRHKPSESFSRYPVSPSSLTVLTKMKKKTLPTTFDDDENTYQRKDKEWRMSIEE